MRRSFLPSRAALSALALCALASSTTLPATAADTPPASEQIAAAVQAAPAGKRDEAKVLGYRDGQLSTLREGSNDLICLADNPNNDNFSVACYHESLEPFMARGRELTAAGVTGKDRKMKRFEEIENGTLAMPRDGKMLYVMNGDGFDAAKGEVTNGSVRWVIYMPFATSESTGISASPSREAPWLMDPGTAGAHVMISP